MIKRAGKEDAERIVEYLKQEESMNTTFLVYLEKYGFEKDFQECWLQTDEHNNKALAVILRHFNNLYIYSEGCSIYNKELGIFTSFMGSEIISGKRNILSEIACDRDDMVLESSCHMVFQDETMLIPCSEVRRAGLEDCRELSELIYSVPEFARFYHSRMEIERGIQRRMELGICRYFILKKDGVISSQAYTTMESSQFATIGGVVTRQEYRKQGLASLVVSCICRDIIHDKKIPNLFYSNEEAGRVYRRLGFEPAGNYGMLVSHQYNLSLYSLS